MGVAMLFVQPGIGFNQQGQTVRERGGGIQTTAQTENDLFFHPLALHRRFVVQFPADTKVEGPKRRSLGEVVVFVGLPSTKRIGPASTGPS